MRRLEVIQKAICPKPHGSIHRLLMLADDRSNKKTSTFTAFGHLFGISVSKLVGHVHFCSSLNYSSNLRIEKYATGTTTYPRDILAHRLLTINQTPVINKTLELVNYKKGNIWRAYGQSV